MKPSNSAPWLSSTARHFLLLALILLVLSVSTSADNNNDETCSQEDDQTCVSPPDPTTTTTTPSYTAFDDVSWAVTSQTLRYPHHQDLYNRYLSACEKDAYCLQGEEFRLYRNNHQPGSMVNFTQAGYAKMKAPAPVWTLLHDFWLQNKDAAVAKETTEVYTPSNLLFGSSPDIVSLLNKTLGGTKALRKRISNAARPILEEWSGLRLAPSSVYGIRVYRRHAMLHPHVDRTNLVISAIINIDQDVQEDWPLELYTHQQQGVAVNITLKPGEMILYESASVIHGRPFPLVGNFYANAFLHFEGIGPLNDLTKCGPNQDGLPPYIVPGSFWVDDWKKRNPKGWTLLDPFKAVVAGDIRTLEYLAYSNPQSLLDKDSNGWTPLHEAARHAADNLDIVDFLLRHGANLQERTGTDQHDDNKNGKLPLEIAREFLGKDHPTTVYLISRTQLTAW
ncbi:Ankyrin Repeat [Seminavis robusta]|uniref:Ankyrin Repeat n=1 Tax=Seminavis robusta TaxID=568900 RepID=A0A9N8EE67_9STRA|nr:Ankyrin Repeat [Seminavis robusta]|eukprot:Sro870_g213600.1 Ankyrin Repeat (450) ;mRNA; r:3761-5221